MQPCQKKSRSHTLQLASRTRGRSKHHIARNRREPKKPHVNRRASSPMPQHRKSFVRHKKYPIFGYVHPKMAIGKLPVILLGIHRECTKEVLDLLRAHKESYQEMLNSLNLVISTHLNSSPKLDSDLVLTHTILSADLLSTPTTVPAPVPPTPSSVPPGAMPKRRPAPPLSTIFYLSRSHLRQ